MNQTIQQSQKSYWLIKESNEYEYEQTYYIFGDFETVKQSLRNTIYYEFNTTTYEAFITDNKIKFTVRDLLNYPINEVESYSFETFEIEAIRKPHIKSDKYLRFDVYNLEHE